MVVTVIVIMPMAVGMSVIVSMPMIVTVAMAMSVAVTMAVAMQLTISMIVPFTAVGFAVSVWVFVENQGLHGHRNGEGGHANATQIDVIKAPKGDAVDDQDLAFDTLVFFENVTQVVSNVAIGDDVEMPSLCQGLGNGP